MDDRNRDRAKEDAERDFADHLLVEEAPGRWRCNRPGTMIYGFWVLVAPFHIIVIGDIGDLILRCSDRNSLAWLRISVDSHDYVLGKAQWEDKEFRPEQACAHLAELRASEDERDHALADAIDEDWDGETGASWDEACHKHWHGFDFPRCRDHSWRRYYLVEALRWFVRAYNAHDTRKECTCIGSCRGKDGLAEGWRCAMEKTP